MTEQNCGERSELEPSALVARTVVETILREGIRDFVLCPGSRSAPLAIALAQAEAAGIAELMVEIDERVAGFIALGLGKAGRPAVVITTSGSAVANLHPAVEEAFASGVPLLVVSADRPHELRGVRASQTTDQTQVLRGSLRGFCDLPINTNDVNAIKNHVRRAVWECLGLGFAGGSGAGPAQLNIAFTTPLQSARSWNCAQLKEVLQKNNKNNAVAQCVVRSELGNRLLGNTHGDLNCGLKFYKQCEPKNTVIVAAPSTLGKSAEFAQMLAAEIGMIPIFAEPGSVLRRLPQAIRAYPELLNNEIAQEIQRVIVIGHPTLTREIAQLLANPEIEVVVVDEPPTFTDVSGNAAAVISLAELGVYATADLQWYRRWERASLVARRQISAHLKSLQQHPEKVQKLTQSEIAIALAESEITTFYAASSVIREVNLYGSCARQEVFVNRGLAGIDGNISTALGIAIALEEPVRVAVGDLAFLHDLGALVRTAGEDRQISLQVVVLDDGGGSLFATLEYGEGDEKIFDRVFRTKKKFDFVQYAKALGEEVKFHEFTGDFQDLTNLFARAPIGIEIIYFNLKGDSMTQIRSQRLLIRDSIQQALAV